jgi:Flp pilus assembly pilin Flp
MNTIAKFFSLLFKKEDGNTATEYGIMLAMIVIACIVGIFSTGDIQEIFWQRTATTLEGIVPP